MAAGVGSLVGPLTGTAPGEITPRGIIVSAVLGGAASVLGGGKFANGAISGAFAYVATALAQGGVTAERGSGSGIVGSRANIQNPGAVFDSAEAAAYDIESQMNSISIAENVEYDWTYYSDSVTGKIGYTDPYATGLIGGPHVALPLTVNGAPVPDALYFGMGHTHGNYSDRYGNVVSKSRDYWDSDNFSRGYPSDMSFMRAGGPNGTWNFFTLGTPSGRLWQWTPWNGQEPLVNQ